MNIISLDESEIQEVDETTFLLQEIYLVSPSGKKYKTTRKAINSSTYLSLYNKYDYKDRTEYTFDNFSSLPSAHILKDINDRHIEKIVAFINELAISPTSNPLDYSKVPTFPDRITLFLPSAIVDKKWWNIVDDLTFEETFGSFNRFVDFLMIEDLKRLTELRMAYWIKEKVRTDLDYLKRPEIKDLLRPIIESDVEKEEFKRSKLF